MLCYISTSTASRLAKQLLKLACIFSATIHSLCVTLVASSSPQDTGLLTHAACHDHTHDQSISSIQVLEKRTSGDSNITLIEKDTVRYIVKQINDIDPCEQFLLVVDTTACMIGRALGLPVNNVDILPANQEHPGKHTQGLPATLHTLAPGKSVEDIPVENIIDFDIHQRRHSCVNTIHEGLHDGIVACMIQHSDLIDLVALDTFCNNTDRSKPNVFYDPTSDSFCGIDMAASFRLPSLALRARNYFENILSKAQEVDATTLQAIKRYTHILQQLVQRFPVQEQQALLIKNAQAAGFTPHSPLYTPDVKERLKRHLSAIATNYTQSEELLCTLSSFLKIREMPDDV